MLNFDVNYLAVLVAAVVYMVLGFLWYSKAMFGSKWMQLMREEGKDIDAMMEGGGNAGAYIASSLGAFVTSFVLAVFISSVGEANLGTGLVVGFLAWLGFTLTTGITNTMYEGGSKGIFLIYTTYNLAAFVVMGAIIGAW